MVELVEGGTPAQPIFQSSLGLGLEMQESWNALGVGTSISDLNGRSFTEIFEMALFPTIEAGIGDNQSLSQTGFNVSTVEVGNSFAPTLTINFDRGEIINGDGSSAGALVGNLQTLNIASPDNPNAYINNSVVGNTDTVTLPNRILTEGNNVYTITGTNLAGTTTYTDNKGGTGTVAMIEAAKGVTTPPTINTY